MKDFFCSILLVVVLSAALSLADFATVPMPGNGMGPKRPGNSGMVLPGKGAEPAHMNSHELTRNDRPSGNRIQTAEKTADPEDTARPENEKENDVAMNEVMIAFWHGVVAVLIGEASALLVAVAWMKIRGVKDAQ